jgi:hypothetical protein
MNVSSNSRGAGRHWLIGCAIITAVILGVVAFGIYSLKKKLGVGVFDVAAKVDPPSLATTDQLLPPVAGTFTREAVTSNSAEFAALLSGVPGDHKVTATSGTVVAYYSDAAHMGALVLAINTQEAQKSGSSSSPFESSAKNARGSNQGFHMQSKFAAMPLGIAGWSKPNWTYGVITTDTVALQFAKGFEPAK